MNRPRIRGFHTRTDDRGSSLVLALAVITVLAALVVAGFHLSAALGESGFRRGRANDLLVLAQSGLEEAMGSVFSGSDDWTGVPPEPVPPTALAGGMMQVVATHLEKDLALVIVRGWVDDDTLSVDVTLVRSDTGGVSIRSWNDPRNWEWPS